MRQLSRDALTAVAGPAPTSTHMLADLNRYR
jgi:hypothetical protein